MRVVSRRISQRAYWQSVAIYRLLQQSAFGPDAIALMVTAYEDCLRTLKLDRSDPQTEAIAKKIIEIAQTGVRDPAQMRRQALAEMDRPSTS